MLVVLLASMPAAQVAAEEAAKDVAPEAPGFVIAQIDGLSEPVLRAALDSGAMPFVQGLIGTGSHTLGSWRTTSASTTTVTQAGLLHGRWRDIPGFRWWDRETGQLIDFLDRDQARAFQEGLNGPDDLLADGGASVTNLFTGGAPRVVFTATDLDLSSIPWEVARYIADLPKALHVVSGFADGLTADVSRVIHRQSAPFLGQDVKRKAPVPIVGPALEWAFADVTAASVVRELQRGTPLVYATFTTYDEVGHYAGPDHPAAIDALSHIDSALRLIAASAEEGPRPYHLIVLSDHGQTEGEPFERRYGESLRDVVSGLMSDGSGAQAEVEPADQVDDFVVAASGNLAHVYFPELGHRLDATEIETLHPGLIAGLTAHPGIGIVVVRTGDDRLVAYGPEGSVDLLSGRSEVRDPVTPYGPLATESLVNIAASPDAGDLVVISTYDPLTNEVASFEPQIGSHGGIGGPQMEPFLLYPSALEADDEPLSLHGVDALRATIMAWMGAPDPRPMPSPSAHIGEQICVSAELEGADSEVCARRDGFGARWELRLTDTEDDGRPVRATVDLGVTDGPDQSATLEHDGGVGEMIRSSGLSSPRVGSGLGDISIRTCVAVRFGRDRCRTSSAPLPQLASRASPSQRARLEQLLFEDSLEAFLAARARALRDGFDADFDWSSNGCSAGPLAGLFDDRLQAACLRHDFAYRNLGRLAYDPTDDARRRVDEQLATDATALGQANLASALRTSLQRFAAPGFFGTDLATAWSVPAFLVPGS